MADVFVLNPGAGQATLSTEPSSGAVLRVTKISAPPPTPKVQYADAREGQLPTDRGYENREIQLTVELVRPRDPDSLHADVVALTAQVAALQASGGTMTWAHDGMPAVTADVTSCTTPGPVLELPYFIARYTSVDLAFTCLPFLRGLERLVAGPATLGAGKRLLDLSGITIPGDVDALARLVVNGATVDQRSVLWAARRGPATEVLEIAASALAPAPVISTPAAGSTNTGAVSASERRAAASPTAAPAGLWVPHYYLRTGDQALIPNTGRWRVYARVAPAGSADSTDGTTITMRLRWSDGPRAGGMTENPSVVVPAVVPGQGTWMLADLGTVAIREGTGVAGEGLDGVIEVATPAPAVFADELLFVPADLGAAGYASTLPPPASISLYDDLTGSGNLATSNATSGGMFVAYGSGAQHVRTAAGTQRSTAATKQPLITAAPVPGTPTSVSISTDIVYGSTAAGRVTGVALGTAVGLTAATTLVNGSLATTGNALAAEVYSGGANWGLAVIDYSTGRVFSTKVPVGKDTAWRIALTWSGTTWTAVATAASSGRKMTLSGRTGTGLPASDVQAGLLDNGSFGAASVSTQRGLVVTTAAVASDVALAAGGTTTITSTAARRTPPGTTGAGPIAQYEGDRPYLPPSGPGAAKVRVVLGAVRGDLREQADTGVDAITGAVYATPRYLLLPS